VVIEATEEILGESDRRFRADLPGYGPLYSSR
jgi:hypothetical protein